MMNPASPLNFERVESGSFESPQSLLALLLVLQFSLFFKRKNGFLLHFLLPFVFLACFRHASSPLLEQDLIQTEHRIPVFITDRLTDSLIASY